MTATIQQTLTKRFTCSYRGEVDYEILDGCRIMARVAVRYSASDDGYYNGNYFQEGILPLVGTVRNDACGKNLEFPLPEIVALFPGFIGARFVFHPRTPHLTIRDEGFELPDTEIQYDGAPPELCPHPSVPGWFSFVGCPDA